VFDPCLISLVDLKPSTVAGARVSVASPPCFTLAACATTPPALTCRGWASPPCHRPGPSPTSVAWSTPHTRAPTALATVLASKSAERCCRPFLSPAPLFSSHRDAHEAPTAPHRLLFAPESKPPPPQPLPLSEFPPQQPPLQFQGASPSPPSPGASGALHRCLRPLQATVVVEHCRTAPFCHLFGAAPLR
jgi:hypothetical protein